MAVTKASRPTGTTTKINRPTITNRKWSDYSGVTWGSLSGVTWEQIKSNFIKINRASSTFTKIARPA